MGNSFNLADVALPFAGLFILYTLARRQSFWPKFNTRWIEIGLFGVLFLLVASLFQAHEISGIVNKWAITNRMAGWVVMMAYFYMGAWLVTNYGDNLIKTFFTTGGWFIVTTAFLFMIGITLGDLGTATDFMPRYPLDTFMGNRNLFAFVFVYIFLAISFFCLNKETQYSVRLLQIFYFLAPCAVIFNGARSLLVLAPFILIFFMAFRWNDFWAKNLLPFIAGLALCFVLMTTTDIGLRESQLERLTTDALLAKEFEADGYRTNSDSVRSIVYHDAIDLFLAHPVFGVGLGNSLEFQVQKHGYLIELIDSIPLWILAELGLVGALVTGSFALIFLFQFYKRVYTQEGLQKAHAQTGIAIIIVFCVMGVFYQLFFIRSFWFILGMLSAVPLFQNHPSTQGSQ